MYSDIDMSMNDDVILISVRVDNDVPADRRVRLCNRLDGPVLPSCRVGVPEPDWDNESLEGAASAGSTVAPDYTILLSPPGDCDVEVVDADGLPEHTVDVEILGCAGESDETADSMSGGTIRSLGSARPSADAVPVSADLLSTVPAPKTPESAPNTADDEHPDPFLRPGPGAADGERSAPLEQSTDADVPTAVETREPCDHEAQQPLEPASLATAERRIDLAEWLDGASIADIVAALSEVGRDVRALESLDADREHLCRLAVRATVFVGRAVNAGPDVGAFQRPV